MFSVPDGRAANQPLSATTFKPPIGALLPGATVNLLRMGSPARCVVETASGESLPSVAFCSGVAAASILA